jgi:hypothetical protein
MRPAMGKSGSNRSGSNRRLILGMGTGRCGTKSLSVVLSRQPSTSVSHEMRPVLPWQHPEARRRIEERIRAVLHRGHGHQIVGDVASYYLNYVEHAIQLMPDTRVICLQRPRDEVVLSFRRWVQDKFGPSFNFWCRPGGGWIGSRIWSPCFPKYDTSDIHEAIGHYCDDYCKEVERLLERFPENIRVFDMSSSLNSDAGLRSLLLFAGVPEDKQVLAVGEHQNQNEAPHS